LQCNDEIKDKMGPNPSESEVMEFFLAKICHTDVFFFFQVSRYTGEFESCATKCVDKNIDVLSKLFDTMRKKLSKGDYSN
jgi:hypothetical protein